MKGQTIPAELAEAEGLAPSMGALTAARTRRRVPAVVLGLGGAAIAAVYGLTVMHLRFGPPLVILGLGGLTLVLSGIALWRVLDPLSRADLPSPTAARAPQRLRELEREKQLVLKAIKETELDYQMRKIAEPDYKEMVDRYRARAMRLISELEAGDNFRPLIERELRDRLAAAEAAPPRAASMATHDAVTTPAISATAQEMNACAACGASNDDDARFCKKCGGKLGSS